MSGNVWFTADTHLGHSRIIQYSKRPFVDHVEMEAVMLERFNQCIKRGDVLYHLGDLAWSTYDIGGFLDRLNTKHMHLVLGNHDRHKLAVYQSRFASVSELKTIKIDGQHAVLCHYPLRSWNGKGHGRFHLFGHCHGSLPGHDRSMDVGVDTNDFWPYAWDEIKQRLADVPRFAETDAEHHNELLR